MIYLVEDDASIRDLVVYTLQNTGLAAEGFPDGDSFWRAVELRTPSMVLLDIMLPGDDGLTILKKLRTERATAKVPVIMLTAKATEYDKVMGLNLGADGYIAKPFGMMELVARINSLYRRVEMNADVTEFNVGGLAVDTLRHTVSVDGESVVLTLKEFDLLVYLLRNFDLVLTRDSLLEAVWSYDFDGETRTVDVHIRSLRSKLGRAGQMVQTVRGLGYKIGEAN